MPATFGLKLGTFTLNATNGITIQSFSEPLTSRVNPINIPRMHGGNLDSSLFIEPKIITMNGIIMGTNKEGYRTSKDAFKAQIETGKQKLYYFDDRYIWIQKVDFPIDDHITGLYGNFSLTLIAVDPFWYATAADYEVYNTDLTSYDFTVTPIGNAPTPPLITLTAGSNFTNPSFQNRSVTNMPSFTHTGAGQAWIVNCPLFTATMGGSNSLSLLSGEFWNLLGSANTIRFTQSAGIAVTIRVDWTDRWW